jgi:hypothetical protein
MIRMREISDNEHSEPGGAIGHAREAPGAAGLDSQESAGRAYKRELLEAHRPVLRFDRQYDYRASSVLTAVDNPGNLLRRRDGEVIARASGEPLLSLETLGSPVYPAGLSPTDEDCLSQAPDVVGDARRMEAQPRYAPRLYGRVVSADRIWLQYWIWLYYNPKNLFGFGKHEGDWEMVQIGLGADGFPKVATYCQHDSGEARTWDEVQTDDPDRRRPLVFVAPLSHASYFDSGTHPYPIGIDHPYGDGPTQSPPTEPLGPWAKWPGRWGNSERVIARRIGNGPPSPAHQGLKWDDPSAFHAKMRRRRFRQWLGKALHFIGTAFFPLKPAVHLETAGGRATVHYELDETWLRRSRHLYLTIHDGERVIASRTVREAAPSGRETLLLPYTPEDPTLWASTFNRVRQRSDLAPGSAALRHTLDSARGVARNEPGPSLFAERASVSLDPGRARR